MGHSGPELGDANSPVDSWTREAWKSVNFESPLGNLKKKSCIGLSGAQRSRMLTTLYKDERCVNLPAYSVLQKMHFERLIRNDEVVLFSHLLHCMHCSSAICLKSPIMFLIAVP